MTKKSFTKPNITHLSTTPSQNPNLLANSPPLEGCLQGGVVKKQLPQGNKKQLPQGNKTQLPQGNKTPMPQGNPIIIQNKIIQLSAPSFMPSNPNLQTRAKELRKAKNLPEVLFWMQVTKGRFYKIDFDRQKVIGNYIVDFFVKKLNLIIEIDGSSHIGKEEYDAAREAYLVSLGLNMYRISVYQIMQQMDSVLLDLENYIVREFGVDVA
jgi:very-short-patch-repair endonuclease